MVGQVCAVICCYYETVVDLKQKLDIKFLATFSSEDTVNPTQLHTEVGLLAE